jgi:hypothetical protein
LRVAPAPLFEVQRKGEKAGWLFLIGGSILEPAGSVARRVGEGLLSSHHLGEQPPGDWSEREAVMGMTEGEPQVLVPLAFANHRDHVGKTRSPAHPRFGLQPLAQGEQFAGQRFVARKLDRARRRVAISELDTGRQANSLAHRREREAAIGVTHGMAKPGIAFDAIMHVVATLYRQGDFVAEGPKDIAGPRGRAPPLLAGTLDDDD